MLTVDPKQRPTAAQLLTHHVFTNVQFDISHIPIAYAEELGLKVDQKSQLVSAHVRPRINQEQISMQQQFGLEVDEIIAKLMINDVFVNFATIEDLYVKIQEYEDQQLHFMISKGIIQSLTNAAIHCIFEFSPNTPLTPSGQSFYLNKSKDYIESDKMNKIQLIRSHYSYMISVCVDILIQFKRARDHIKQIFTNIVLQEILVSFLEPVHYIKKEYLEALDCTIPFFAPKQVEVLVESKELILHLSQAAIMFSKDKPDITNLAVKILAAVAKHGIKLVEGALRLILGQDNFAQLLQITENGDKVDIPKTQEHPFKQFYEKSGARDHIELVFNQTMEKLKQYRILRDYVAKDGSCNPSINCGPKVDMTLKIS
ncbi:MAG: hypothetical protein EZS28_042768, partial [Streblomastix strix]